MAVDKLVDSGKLDACCEAEAAAIIAKGGGTAPISYDFANNKGFADAIAAIPSGGGDIATPWVTIKTQEVVIGANNVTQPVEAVAYFEGIVGQGNVEGIFLKEEKTEYVNNELLAFSVKGIGSGASGASILAYRMRSGMVNSLNMTSGYDLRLSEGSTYILRYYTNKP